MIKINNHELKFQSKLVGERAPTIALALMSALAMPAAAVEFELDNGPGITWENKVSLTTLSRLDDPARGIVGQGSQYDLAQANQDDGSKNFDKTIVSNLFKYTADIDVRFEHFGLFTRVNAIWDTEVDNAQNTHDRAETNNGSSINGGSLLDDNDFTDATVDKAGKDIKLLDFYLYGSLNEGSTNELSYRLGQHVVSWGEAAFSPSALSVFINPIDVGRVSQPGSEIKEFVLPTLGASFGFDISTDISVEAFYMFAFEEAQLPAYGTFFSFLDQAGDGATNQIFPLSTLNPGFAGLNVAFERQEDKMAKDGGQYGTSLRWYVEELNDTEFGLYYVNYHAKRPSITLIHGVGDAKHATTLLNTLPPAVIAGIDAGLAGAGMPPAAAFFPLIDSTGYRLDYVEDVTAFGASFATTVFGYALAGEIIMHRNTPVQTKQTGDVLQSLLALGPTGFGTEGKNWTREDVIAANFTSIIDVKSNFLADNTLIVAELTVEQVTSTDSLFLSGDTAPDDKTTYGFGMSAELVNFDVMSSLLSGVDLKTAMSLSTGIKGYSALGSFSQNSGSASISFEFDYADIYQLTVGYNEYFGGNNVLNDRDNVAVSLSMRF